MGLAWIAVFAILLMDADVPQVFQLRPQSAPQVTQLADQSLPVLPDFVPLDNKNNPAEDKKDGRLQPHSRLALVRAISGEFARAVRPLPGGKKGFRIKAGEAVDEKALRQAIAREGAAINTGDTLQITRLAFQEREIVFEINGGRPKTRWRDRIQVSVGGGMPRGTTKTPDSTPGYQAAGTTLYLDFGRPLPDLTPAELQRHLSSVLDFSKQRSAAVQWVETLPPEFQKAIKEKRPEVGMDREMVIAAIGRPERKVRERDPHGAEIEDWIYGQPPAKTLFVRFAGERVVSVKQYP